MQKKYYTYNELKTLFNKPFSSSATFAFYSPLKLQKEFSLDQNPYKI